MWRKLVVTHRTKIKRLVRGLGQSTLSLSFNIGGLLAGVLLNIYFDVFSITSWALILFPRVLSTRGAIGGVFLFYGCIWLVSLFGWLNLPALITSNPLHICDLVFSVAFSLSLIYVATYFLRLS